jgi:hypothetical protein
VRVFLEGMMHHLYLFEQPNGTGHIYACRFEDILTEMLPRGTRVWDLGVADEKLPTGRFLMLVGHVPPIIHMNARLVLTGTLET